MFVIPIADYNSQSMESVLDDELFYIDLDWNQTGQYWELGIRNSSYITLLDGICVVPNCTMLLQFKYPDVPLGDFMAYIDRKFNGAPGRQDFVNGRFEFVYFTKEDVLATINAVR
jgi:hypothetical protein